MDDDGSIVQIMPALNLNVFGWLALAGVTALAVWAPVRESDIAASVPAQEATVVDSALPMRMANSSSATRLGVPNEFPTRGTLAATRVTLWSAQTWLPTSPVVAPAPSPTPMLPPPAPPAMHYRYAGQVLRDGQLQIFVAKDDTPVAVKPGDSLDGYVVESISADVITLVYLPLGNKAIIAISPAHTL